MNYLKTLKNLFRSPSGPNENKKESSLLELFLDLVWVAILAGGVHQCTRIIEHSLESENYLDYFSLFYIIFEIIFLIFIWKVITFYSSRYEDRTFRHRLIIMFLMLGLIFLSCSIFIDIDHNLENFGLLTSINLLGASIIFMTFFYAFFSLWRKKTKNPYERKLLFRSLMGFVTSWFIFLPSFVVVIYDYIFLTQNNNEIINNLKWVFVCPSLILGLVIWIVWDWFSRSSKILLNIKDHSQEHIKDRQNVIFIVFIGEVVMQIVSSSEHFENMGGRSTFIFESLLLLATCFLTMFIWWWIFNDTVNFPEISDNPRKSNAYSFFGLFILISLVFHSIGFPLLIKGFFESREHFHLSKDITQWGKMIVSIGILFWSIGHSGMSYCIKHYKKSTKMAFEGFYQFITSIGFFTFIIFFIFSFIPSINQVMFLVLLFSGNTTFLIIWIFLLPKVSNFPKEEIDILIIRDEQKIKKEFKKYIDFKIHRKYNFKLNYYSKFIDEEEKK